MNAEKIATDAHLQAVEALLKNYSMAWKQLRTEGIAACWDPSRFVFYKAEEVETFFYDWQQALDYWRGNEGLHQAVSLRFTDIQARWLNEALLVATTRMRWDIRFSDEATVANGGVFPHRGKAMGGDNHVVIFINPDEAGWKICGWSETPDAPITYMRALYLNNADTRLV